MSPSSTAPAAQPGRLPDGTPYYGRLGEIAYDPDEDKVQCHLCGQWFRWVGGTHLTRKHDWTIREYREAFHLYQRTSTAAAGLIERHRERLRQRVDAGELVPLGPDRAPVIRERVAGAETMPYWRSLAARRPDLASQWHTTRNGQLAAEQIALHSTTPLWWRCGRCGHEWQAAPKDRRHQPPGYCPQCGGPDGRPPRGSRARSLAERPDLLAELHPTRNPGLDPAQIPARGTTRLWWRCAACGHSWQTTAAVRAGGSGCPQCALENNQRSAYVVSADRSLATLHPEIAAELHPARNPGIELARLGARSGLRLRWRCSTCHHEWQAKVYVRTNGAGCPVCRASRPGPSGQSFADARPDLLAEWHPTRNGELTPATVSARSSRTVWWRCAECGHEWEATVSARWRSPHGGCRDCSRIFVKRVRHAQGQSLAARHPELLSELHPTRNPGIDPTQLGARSAEKLWWRCPDCGHEWKTCVSTRTSGHGCPACYRARQRQAR